MHFICSRVEEIEKFLAEKKDLRWRPLLYTLLLNNDWLLYNLQINIIVFRCDLLDKGISLCVKLNMHYIL